MGYFQLALPMTSLRRTRHFYRTYFSAGIASQSPGHITLILFGQQLEFRLVTRLKEPQTFGLVLMEREELEELYAFCRQSYPLEKQVPMRWCCPQSAHAHLSFRINDPSGHGLNIQWYANADYHEAGSREQAYA